jgi:hypothetical protein
MIVAESIDEELHNLYSSLNIRFIKSIKMKWVGHAARMVEMRKEYKILIGRPKTKMPLGGIGCRNKLK